MTTYYAVEGSEIVFEVEADTREQAYTLANAEADTMEKSCRSSWYIFGIILTPDEYRQQFPADNEAAVRY